jgi:hypothetical protein
MNCPKCAEPIPAGETACPPCQRARMGVDINARVMWGDPLDEIRNDWLTKGVRAEAVEEALNAAIRERRAHFRQRGTWDVLSALGLFIVGGIGFWITRVEASGEVFRLGGRLSVIVAMAAFGAPLAGILLGIRGVRRLCVGGEADEAASDIDHSD